MVPLGDFFTDEVVVYRKGGNCKADILFIVGDPRIFTICICTEIKDVLYHSK